MSKREIKCAECGQPADEHGEMGDDEVWDEPFCRRCQRDLTIEGLLIEIRGNGPKEQVRELGRSRAVVLEYDRNTRGNADAAEAERFLRRIYDLKQHSKGEGRVVNRQQYIDALANLPLAEDRFRRWFREDYRGRPLEVTERRLASLARALLEQQSDDDTEIAISEGEDRRLEIALDWFASYESTMHFEKPLVIKGRLPTFVRDLIYESQDAFRWGLPKATIASCRMAIEELVKAIAKVQSIKLSETTRRRIQGLQKRSYPTMATLVLELPQKCLIPSEKDGLLKLWNACSEVIHGRRREGPQMIGPLDKSAWRILRRTIEFISILMERDSLTA
jgi:hypothetical protein